MIGWVAGLAGAAPAVEVGATVEYAPEPWVVVGWSPVEPPRVTPPIGAEVGVISGASRVAFRLGAVSTVSSVTETVPEEARVLAWTFEARAGARVVIGPLDGPTVFSMEAAVQLGTLLARSEAEPRQCLSLRPAVWLGEGGARAWVAFDFRWGGDGYTGAHGFPAVFVGPYRWYRAREGVALLAGARFGRR